jgi:hypothetical protein
MYVDIKSFENIANFRYLEMRAANQNCINEKLKQTNFVEYLLPQET